MRALGQLEEVVKTAWSVDPHGYQLLLEAMPAGIVIVRDDGTISAANRRTHEMFGYPDGSLLGRPLDILIPASRRPGHAKQLRAYFADPQPRPLGNGRELTAVHCNGDEFPIEIGLNPLVTMDGLRILATLTDITQRKKAETALRNSNDSLEEFAYVASHDLRSPLHSLVDLLNWIREDLGGQVPDSVTKNLDRAKHRIGTLEKLIDDLLAYARAGNDGHEAEQFEPRAAVDKWIEVRAPLHGITVLNEIPSITLSIEKIPIETVLRNLIDNAIKHHDLDQGKVRVGLNLKNGYAHFYVADDGPGIPLDAKERVFKLFQTATGNDMQGGVGLAVAKRFVDTYRGKIWLDDNENSRGTTFHLEWPLGKA